MKLTGQHPRVVFDFNYFHQPIVRGQPTGDEPLLLQWLAKVVVEFKSVAMPFINYGFTIRLSRVCAWDQVAGVYAQPHGATHASDLMLFREQVNYRIRRIGVKLGRVGQLTAQGVASKFNNHDLHAQA